MKARFVEARAPGKLIVLGEHAVVSGAAAMALALKRYTYARLDLKPLETRDYMTSRFVREESWGPYPMNDPSLPASLYWAKEMLQVTKPSSFQGAIHWEIKSEIELGHGMGSSAAAICSSYSAMSTLFEKDYEKRQLWPFLTSIESICHGKSSGIDVATSLQGGFIKFQQGHFSNLENMSVKDWYLIDTGKPKQSTKECVLHSQAVFAKDSGLLNEMKSIAQIFIERAGSSSFEELQVYIKHWNQLQKRLGIVPEGIQNLINRIERLGASAKVCGAGALEGSQAGLILILASFEVANLLKSDGLKLESVEVDHEGSCVTLLG